jgi:2-oxoisovalerate dehydrogenase E1 component
MGQWKVEVGATVEIGQELGTILVEGAKLEEQKRTDAPSRGKDSAAAVSGGRPGRSAREDRRSYTIEPALSPTLTRKLSRVIPANLQIDARWDALRKARDAAKKENGRNAPSPSVMIAWAVVRAMEKHPPFRRLILEDETIVEYENFDLGIAVAIEGDRLATAVMTEANRKSWKEFADVYRKIVDETRAGRVDAMNAPVVISSLGAFGVRAAAPIVVPPSVGTLFIGSAHRDMLPNGKKNETAEVITLSLTFDHRVVNGAGAANFVHEIKEQIEHFSLKSVVAAGAV